MNLETKYKICRLKAYFDAGYNLSYYIKYFVILFGLSSRDVSTTLIMGAIYGVLCFIVGYLWYKYGWVIAQKEVSNRYNLFVKEMRNKLKKRKI